MLTGGELRGEDDLVVLGLPKGLAQEGGQGAGLRFGGPQLQVGDRPGPEKGMETPPPARPAPAGPRPPRDGAGWSWCSRSPPGQIPPDITAGRGEKCFRSRRAKR